MADTEERVREVEAKVERLEAETAVKELARARQRPGQGPSQRQECKLGLQPEKRRVYM